MSDYHHRRVASFAVGAEIDLRGNVVAGGSSRVTSRVAGSCVGGCDRVAGSRVAGGSSPSIGAARAAAPARAVAPPTPHLLPWRRRRWRGRQRRGRPRRRRLVDRLTVVIPIPRISCFDVHCDTDLESDRVSEYHPKQVWPASSWCRTRSAGERGCESFRTASSFGCCVRRPRPPPRTRGPL